MNIMVANAKHPVVAKHPAKLAKHPANHHAKHAEAADAEHLAEHLAKPAKNLAADAAVVHASK